MPRVEPPLTRGFKDPCIQIVPARPVTTPPPEEQRRPLFHRARTFTGAGILLGILSSFCFSVAIFLVKASKTVDPVQFVVCRAYFQFFMMAALASYQGRSLSICMDKEVVLWLLLSGVFGAVQQVTSYYAVSLISLADGTAVLLSAPVFVSIFACVLLKEKCGFMQVVTVLLALMGVLLVCRPTFLFGAPESGVIISSGNRVLGFSLVGLGCILMAAMYITLRKAMHVPYPITNGVLALCSIGIALPYMLVTGKGLAIGDCGLESAYVVISAVLGTVGMLLFVLATQIEYAGPLSVARSSEIVFAFCWQMSILGDIPSWTSLAGACAIVSSVAIIGLERWKTQNLAAYQRFVDAISCCRRAKVSKRKYQKEMQVMAPSDIDNNVIGDHVENNIKC